MTDMQQHRVIDEIELEEIILSKTNPLLKYCYGLLCNHADAEDAVQLTFIKLYRNRNNIDWNKSLNTYLYKIAYSTSIDIMRKKKKVTLLGEAKDEEGYTEEGYGDAFPEDLKIALLALDPMDRGLVVNRVIHEMSYKELSDLYGKSEAYLRKRYERTRKRLSNQISDDFSGLAKKGV
jgi:RNA polymerase sigma-70 factor, ECF subfamily